MAWGFLLELGLGVVDLNMMTPASVMRLMIVRMVFVFMFLLLIIFVWLSKFLY